ncbi:MAG: DUF2065 domain-containing protein [Hydrogenophaga sp.]|jgi:uncharacterized protein YjeT (DUF2065 family)|nr:DUF2065 domain-containing protein [Hydrogenophaga sp.]
MSDVLWLALALMLVLEGLLPMLAPARWRQMFSEILKLNDGQIRFFGLACVGVGLLLYWWLAPA